MRNHHHATEYITLNSHLCQACWECVNSCPEGVIGKIDLPFHKHAGIKNPEKCQGCLKCAEVCPQLAFTVN